jgi:hypothetical protein
VFTPRTIGFAAALAVAVAAATAPVAGAARPAAPSAHATASPGARAHRARPLSRAALAKAKPVHRGSAHAASVSSAWYGASATCVGTSMSISMGRNFGLPMGTHFRWRSRLLIYNSRTGTNQMTAYGPWMYDEMPNPSGYIFINGSWWFVMGPSGGILPTFSPTDAWTSAGAWVYPYVQVEGYGERPVNITGVAGTGRYSDPNWCWLG